jgi:hypothetical protein
MAIYDLQKLIRNVNRDPAFRRAFFEAPEKVMGSYDLTPDEGRSLVDRNYGALYRLGVHGLLLRPLSILHNVAEEDYLRAIREVPPS